MARRRIALANAALLLLSLPPLLGNRVQESERRIGGGLLDAVPAKDLETVTVTIETAEGAKSQRPLHLQRDLPLRDIIAALRANGYDGASSLQRRVRVPGEDPVLLELLSAMDVVAGDELVIVQHPAQECAALWYGGNHSAAHACYTKAAEAMPTDADVVFNLGVATKSLVDASWNGASFSDEERAGLRKALTLYERAEEVGGDQLSYMIAQADAHCRLNQLDQAVAIYTSIDRFRRGVPFNVSPGAPSASESEVARAVQAVLQDRAASTPGKLAKWETVWAHREDPDFKAKVAGVCEPDEADHLHPVFQPGVMAPEGPLPRFSSPL